MATTPVSAHVLRYAAFTDDPVGGNPAGIVLDASSLDAERMLQIAREVGYSETAFLLPRVGVSGEYDVRYFSPKAEVPFCGHATVAAGVALAQSEGPGELVFHVMAGPVPVHTRCDASGLATASLTSVQPHVEEAGDDVIGEVLKALRWRRDELEPELPPADRFCGSAPSDTGGRDAAALGGARLRLRAPKGPHAQA